MALAVYAVLVGISPGYPPVAGRLHTCYSPVRRSPAAFSKLTAPLPLDLHVLSLSLAFILSQDQTLRCYILFFIFLVLRPWRFRHDFRHAFSFSPLTNSLSARMPFIVRCISLPVSYLLNSSVSWRKLYHFMTSLTLSLTVFLCTTFVLLQIFQWPLSLLSRLFYSRKRVQS